MLNTITFESEKLSWLRGFFKENKSKVPVYSSSRNLCSHKRLGGYAENQKNCLFFLPHYTAHDQFFIPESTRVDISNMFALLVSENRQLQRPSRSFQKVVIGNLSQQDKTRAVRKCKLEYVLC